RSGRGGLPVARGGTDAVRRKSRVPYLDSRAARVGMHPLTRLGPRLGPAVGTLFVVSACAGKHCRTARAAKEPPMRQPRSCSVPQRHASPLDVQSLQHLGASMPPRRASRVVAFVLGLALGTGVAVLFSLLRTWFCA